MGRPAGSRRSTGQYSESHSETHSETHSGTESAPPVRWRCSTASGWRCLTAPHWRWSTAPDWRCSMELRWCRSTSWGPGSVLSSCESRRAEARKQPGCSCRGRWRPKRKWRKPTCECWNSSLLRAFFSWQGATKDAKGSADLSYKWFFQFRNKLPPRCPAPSGAVG
jgi:hypothetical protein